MTKKQTRKVVKIEPIVRDKKDFLTRPKMGYSGYRVKYSNSNENKKLERPLEDRLRFNVKKNHCVMCDKEATKLVYLAIKGGGLQLEKYCGTCFENFIDLDKMEMKPLKFCYQRLDAI